MLFAEINFEPDDVMTSINVPESDWAVSLDG